ncbi:hypothetical protein [Streptomyces sp. 8N706]|uniref:hypothetical protein n=1 Tax=Streptomyces sp. 8N706 TaxID=3457416 RepID=UPI003FD18A3D
MSDLTCEELRHLGAELALGILPGQERAAVIAHLDRCAGCREQIEQLTLAGDGLLSLLPGSEPPVGFEKRVLTRLGLSGRGSGRGVSGRSGRRASAEAPPTHRPPGGARLPHRPPRGAPSPQRPSDEQRARGRSGEAPAPSRSSGEDVPPYRSSDEVPPVHRHRRPRRRRFRAAVAAAIMAIAFGFGGWAVGTALQDDPAQPSATSRATVMRADFTAGDQHAGQVFAHPDPGGWVYMSIDLDSYPAEGKVSCQLVRTDGSTVPVGSFTLKGYEAYHGYWGAPARVDPSTLAGARLVGADGAVLATARFD